MSAQLWRQPFRKSLLVGIGVFVISLVIVAVGGRSRSTTRTDVRETPSGQERTEQKDDWSTP
jgi:hypothetical protein